MTESCNGVAYITITAGAGIGCITVRGACGRCYSSLIGVTESRNSVVNIGVTTLAGISCIAVCDTGGRRYSSCIRVTCCCNSVVDISVCASPDSKTSVGVIVVE